MSRMLVLRGSACCTVFAALVALQAPRTAHGQACPANADGTPNCAVMALQTPYQTSTATSGTVAMAAQIGILCLNGSSLLSGLTVKLPPNPTDQQIARVFVLNGVTTLTVQDANGVAIATVTGLGTLATTIWQFQATAWKRVG
jgi:hypothetical protein